jgi:hypothetical protein
MIHRRRDMVAIGPCPTKERPLASRSVAGGKSSQGALDLQLALMVRQVDRLVAPSGLRDIDKQIINARHADCRQHGGAIIGG